MWSQRTVVLHPSPFPLLLLLLLQGCCVGLQQRRGGRGGLGSMGRTGTRLPSFCLNRVSTRVRVRSPPIESSKPGEPSSTGNNGGVKQEPGGGRRIVVVIDHSPEAKAALQWALSHSAQSNDTVVLVQILKPSSKHGDGVIQIERCPKGSELLHSMKSFCQTKKPEVRVELCAVEGRERGPAIVEEAVRQGAALLVMGQKKRSVTWRLLMMWAGTGSKVKGGDVVDYCIQNAMCMALAVRRKSNRGGGGYLITTKRHRDFWLLA